MTVDHLVAIWWRRQLLFFVDWINQIRQGITYANGRAYESYKLINYHSPSIFILNPDDVAPMCEIETALFFRDWTSWSLRFIYFLDSPYRKLLSAYFTSSTSFTRSLFTLHDNSPTTAQGWHEYSPRWLPITSRSLPRPMPWSSKLGVRVWWSEVYSLWPLSLFPIWNHIFSCTSSSSLR